MLVFDILTLHAAYVVHRIADRLIIAIIHEAYTFSQEPFLDDLLIVRVGAL